MSTFSSVRFEYDKKKRIVHVAFCELLTIHTENELYALFEQLENYLCSQCKKQRHFIVVDISNLIINQELAHQYAMEVGRIAKTYLHKDGIARYGYQITRIIIKRAYDEYLKRDPRIFRTKKEAFDYIESLVEQENPQDWVETTSLLSSRAF